MTDFILIGKSKIRLFLGKLVGVLILVGLSAWLLAILEVPTPAFFTLLSIVALISLRLNW